MRTTLMKQSPPKSAIRPFGTSWNCHVSQISTHREWEIECLLSILPGPSLVSAPATSPSSRGSPLDKSPLGPFHVAQPCSRPLLPVTVRGFTAAVAVAAAIMEEKRSSSTIPLTLPNVITPVSPSSTIRILTVPSSHSHPNSRASHRPNSARLISRPMHSRFPSSLAEVSFLSVSAHLIPLTALI